MAEGRHGSSPLLETRALCRNFEGLKAVREVSITLSPGELHAVIGPNGAGKSTLVHLLSGELAPSSGDILLSAETVARLPAWRRVHLGVARSFQRTNIFRPLTASENVRLAAQAVAPEGRRMLRSAASVKALHEAAESALERAGLGWAAGQIAGTLSHGAQRQLEIAMTLASRPKVILLDEPLAGMGPEEGERIAALLRGLASDHAILLIEHDMDFVFAVADWMTVMVDGAVIASGKPADIRANADVQHAYLGGHA
jgi:branched-chain amino acid transport system ATP-binding protein